MSKHLRQSFSDGIDHFWLSRCLQRERDHELEECFANLWNLCQHHGRLEIQSETMLTELMRNLAPTTQTCRHSCRWQMYSFKLHGAVTFLVDTCSVDFSMFNLERGGEHLGGTIYWSIINIGK